MTLTRILEGLEANTATGAQARGDARRGFLEWIFAMPGPVTAQMVRAALDEPAVHAAESDAARAFVECLQEACQVSLACPRRRDRIRALH
ncbi:hypothetical protein SAMN05443999_103273 [Roseovarius azorensis]|uniref:Uncharacterized protein n=1 Tax=Roseovarius azorensis TaxID=1287727 RepID=A0A1H7MCP2_9RHOB|nr:hypothetical protein [Roseovarius azorensis]SEL08963.1 hypothetical protein SAMN05443999_103273 [Roseovarius azorensis]